MKVSKVLATVLVSTFVLAACGNGGTGKTDGSKDGGDEAGLVREYNNVFSKDLEILDYTFSQRKTNGDHFTNFVDGLLENDNLGNQTNLINANKL